jgi:hypothetical protein
MRPILDGTKSERVDPFAKGLQDWVNSAPSLEKANRIRAMQRMKEAKDNRSTYLDLGGLGLSSLPSQIGDLPNLTKLNLKYNELTTLPPQIENLHALTNLYLYSNRITTLPPQIENLHALTELDLGDNQLNTLPPQIWNLHALTKLNLSSNRLNTLPSQIGNLHALTNLNLSSNRLDTLPSQIGNLHALTNLDLYSNRINTLPQEIENLHALTELDLGENRLTTLPQEIENLHALTELHLLHLNDNRLTTIPDSLLAARPNFSVNLQRNLIPPNEAQRLSVLARDNGVRLDISIQDYTQLTTPQEEDQTAMVIKKILDISPDQEKKEELDTFFESPGLENFKMFLAQCPHTEGWKSHETEMTGCLLEIANMMMLSVAAQTKCETLAETALGTCGDRVGLAFVQMQLLNLSDKKVEDMSIQEVYDCAKKESVIKFLSEKTEAKIVQIATTGGVSDEIETFLAYLQAGSDLGLKLTANGMLYRGCSNVTDSDLESAKKEFLELGFEYRIAEYIYEDGGLRKHPFVNKIIEEVSAEKGSDTEKKEDETEEIYLNRVNDLASNIRQTTISEIQKAIQGELLVEGADSTPDTTVTLLAANRTNAATDTGCCNVM